MSRRFLGREALLALAALAVPLVLHSTAWGQAAGVYVDSDGVLRSKVREESTGRLQDQRRRAREASSARAGQGAAGDASRPSPLRKISLTRLSEAVVQVIASDEPVPEEMRHLAGLHGIEFLFTYPDTGDVVLAGPAEGWVTDESGRVVGSKSGRPVILLDDLAVALRAFASESEAPVVGCSFEPSPAGLARVQEVVKQVGAVERDPGFMSALVERLRAAQGMHEIRVFGVPADTHLALVMVEADYRLKRIGIDLEPPPVPRFQSYLDFAARGGSGGGDGELFNRWWFMPEYEAIEASADGNAYHFRGQRLRILTEMDYLDATGQRTGSGKANRASLRYAEHFTQRYPEIAAAAPVYAALENVVDLIVTAAILERENLPERIGGSLEGLVSPRADFVERFNLPRHVEPSVNYRFKRRGVVLSVGGGVVLNAGAALSKSEQTGRENGTLDAAQQDAVAKADARWWWD